MPFLPLFAPQGFSLTIAPGATTGTFTLTPLTTAGNRNIAITTSPTLTIAGSPITYSATVGTVTASAAITLGSLVTSGPARFTSPSSAAITLGSLTIASAPRFTAPASGAVALGSLVVAGAGAFSTASSGAITLGSISVAAAPAFTSPASGAITLGSLAIAATPLFKSPSTGAITLGSLAMAGAGGPQNNASGAITLGALTAAGLASSGIFAAGTVTLGSLVIAASPLFTTPSSGAISLGSLAVAGAAAPQVSGTGAITLGALTAAGLAASGIFASGALALGALGVAGAGAFTALSSGAITLGSLVAVSRISWYDPAWLYRLPVTVDNSANLTSALSYYQVGVSLTGAAYTSYNAHANANGSDIRITDSDGTTLLSHMIEGTDNTNSAVHLLIKVPAVAAGAQRSLYIYYGNAAATSVAGYSIAVKPTTAIVGPTDEYTQTDTANFNANPATVLLQNQGGVNGGGAGLNGKILCFLMVGANSNGDRTNGSLAVMSSTDGGVTWGSKSILLTHTATNEAEPRSVVELADGTILLAYSTDTFANSSAGKAQFYIAKSTDGGSTWSNLSITAPANVVTVPWTYGTNVGAPYGRMIEKTAGGDLFLPVYGILTGDTGWHAWLLKCPSGSDPTNGSNWVTQGTIAFDNVNKFSETSLVQTTDSSHLLAILRNDTVGDLYSSTSADSGVTWTTPAGLGLPGILVNTFGAAVSPELLKLTSGNLLLCWGVRYGSDFGSTAAVISTDGGATWLDRIPYATTTGNTSTLWDGGYPTAVQNADGTICVLAYRNTGTLATSNVFRMIITEDYVCNVNNIYTPCESFGSVFASHGANATISSTHAHGGTNAVKIDNSAATGGIADSVVISAWSANTAQKTAKIAYSYWSYETANDTNWVSRVNSSTTLNSGSRVNESVFGSNSNHLQWLLGASYQDTGVVVPANRWNKHTLKADVEPSTVTGELLINNVIATTGLGQIAAGNPPLTIQIQGASVAATHNVIFWVDDIYTHQYTPNTPTTAIGAEQTFSAPPTFTAVSLGSVTLASLAVSGVSVAQNNASGAITLGALGVSASPLFTAPSSGAVTLGALTAAGLAGSGLFATGAVTLGSLSVSSAGIFTTASSGALTLGALNISAAPLFTSPSSGAVTLGALTAAGLAGSGIFATGTITLGALGVSGSGAFATASSGAVSLGSLVISSSVAFRAGASGAVTLGALSVSSLVGSGIFAAGSITLGSLGVSGAGAFATPSSGAVSLGALAAAGVAGSRFFAAGAVTLGSLTTTSAVTFTSPGSGAISLGALSSTGGGRFTASALGSVALAGLIGSGVAQGGITAVGSILLAGLVVTGVADGGGGPIDLIVYPDPFAASLVSGVVSPFAATAVSSVADPFGAAVVTSTVNPFASTAKLKGN